MPADPRQIDAHIREALDRLCNERDSDEWETPEWTERIKFALTDLSTKFNSRCYSTVHSATSDKEGWARVRSGVLPPPVPRSVRV